MKYLSLFVALTACFSLMLDPALKAADPGTDQPARVVDLQGNPVPVELTEPTLQPGATPALKVPRLDVFPTKMALPKGTFIVCPGGAYHFLSMKNEGTIPADFLNSQGYDVVILEYTVGPGDVASQALKDALATVNLLKQSADRLGIHNATLGMMGFSAGGHLTARTVHELGTAGPFAKVVMIYPAYLDGPGGINDAVKPPEGVKTQLFVAIGDKDSPSWVSGSRSYVEAAKANGGDAEFHLLPGIPHAFGVTPGDPLTTADFKQKLSAFLAR